MARRKSPAKEPTSATEVPDAPWALVLAGGDGTRLQPLTCRVAGAPIPKQYCRLVGDRSLLELTLARVAIVRTLTSRNQPLPWWAEEVLAGVA